jgi:two-component system, chemotaxis family, protein-glutamate methylesterase/glutaminase
MSTRVLIVDDSALIRMVLTELLDSNADITVVGVAPNPLVAREKIKMLNPDVLTLDIEMPHMDGLSFLEKIMALRPMPVVVVSSLTQKGADAALRALALGAVDYVAKPLKDLRQGMHALRDELVAKVRAAARARVRPRPSGAVRPVMLRPVPATRLIAIGASTGGVEALHELLTAMPAAAPPILVTQHMPAGFTASFAQRLDKECAMTVIEAVDRAPVADGHVYIAAGGYHLELARLGTDWCCRSRQGPPVSGHAPSVNVLFRSVTAAAGIGATGVILTGMGSDGAEGLLAMRQAGARTFGQDEASSVVYGMPKAARLLGAVQQEVPLSRLAEAILG